MSKNEDFFVVQNINKNINSDCSTTQISFESPFLFGFYTERKLTKLEVILMSMTVT